MDQFTSIASEKPVLVIGAASVDIVGRLRSEEPRLGTSNPAQILTSFGGVARNVAENLARLGQPVILLSVVGNDEAGSRLLEQTHAAGVNVDYVERSLNHPTGSYLGVVNANGKLQIALDDMRAIAELSSDVVRKHAALFAESALVFMDANLPKETLRTVMSLARKTKLPVCADPASTLLANRLRLHLPRLQMITPNIAEASVLVDQGTVVSRLQEAIPIAKNLVSRGVAIVIIAMAELGVCYATSETSGQIPAISTPVVDPTGAGDAMTATVLFGLLNEMSIDEAVRLGVSAASLTLGHRGAVVPDLTLEKLYDHLVV